MAAQYFMYQHHPTAKHYAMTISDLRMNAIVWMMCQKGNMEMKIPLYKDGPIPQIVGWVFFKWLNGTAYIVYTNASAL